jgi:hypothetical protein
VTQDDGQANLSLIAKISPGCRGLFRTRGDWRKVVYMNYMRCMVGDPTRIERRKLVAC